MSVVGEAMQERSRGQSVNDLLRRNNRAEWCVAAGKALGSDQNVRRNFPVFDGEISSSPAHPRHDLIGDQQHAMATANFGNLLQISGRWDNRAQSSAADRLKDESRGFTFGGFDGLL